MREVQINGIYRHFKGNKYRVEALAKDSETQRDVVVYRALYGEGGLWVRDMEMFLSEVDHQKYPEVEQKHRFELIEE